MKALAPLLAGIVIGIAAWRVWTVNRRSEAGRWFTDTWLQVIGALVGVIIVFILIQVAIDVSRNI